MGLAVYRATNAADAAKAHPRIVVIGDSRVAQWAPRPQVNGLAIVWRGIGGQSTAQIRGRFAQDVLALRPSGVVIAAGINDLMAMAALSRPATGDAQVVEHLSAMADQAREAGVQTFVATVVRPHKPGLLKLPFWPADIQERVHVINQRIRAGAPGRYCVLDLDAALSKGVPGSLRSDYATDDLHLSMAAYEELNALLSRELTRACRGL